MKNNKKLMKNRCLKCKHFEERKGIFLIWYMCNKSNCLNKVFNSKCEDYERRIN